MAVGPSGPVAGGGGRRRDGGGSMRRRSGRQHALHHAGADADGATDLQHAHAASAATCAQTCAHRDDDGAESRYVSVAFRRRAPGFILRCGHFQAVASCASDDRRSREAEIVFQWRLPGLVGRNSASDASVSLTRWRSGSAAGTMICACVAAWSSIASRIASSVSNASVAL
jgi:hypothetical protein